MPSREFHELVVHARANPIDPQISLTELRQGFDAMGLSFTPPEDVSLEEVSASGVRAEWVRVPESMESAVLLYLHGGGYTMGSTKAYRGFVARLAREGQTRALSIDYRLAPEHPYPAAIDDIVKSYKWLLAQHVDPARVIIAGDSAGGGLTLATLLELREKGITLPAAAVCLSPSTDLAQTGESITSKAADDIFLTSPLLDFCYGNFLGPDGDPTNPFVSPLYADLTGLPPLLVMVGTAEILLEDSIRLAAKAKAAGVDVDLVIGEEMFHVWPFFAAILPEGQEALGKIGTFIRHHLKG